MKPVDRLIENITAFLVHLLLNPKVYYIDPSRQKNIIKEPSIIVCNHTSHLDGPVVNTVFRKNTIHTLAAKDRFEQKGFGFFLRHTGCIPIDRKNFDTSWVHTALKTLQKDKENIAIYPEGRHGQHRQQLPFHTGVTMLTTIARVPIIMVYMDGPHRFFHRSRLVVAPPFRLEPSENMMNPEHIESQTRLLEQKMKELMEQFILLDSNK